MKLIIVIFPSEYATQIQNHLNKEFFFHTRLSTKGGFLKETNATLIIGLKEEKIERVLEIIKIHSKTKTQMIPNNVLNEFGATFFPLSSEISISGATVFILDVEKFYKL
ncbi:cyclic-di-AMP receptor [Candidatus Phytoplasma pini]|uniref:Transcriptional regulator n=1 Tax=Candidatus Phytoplasma pini TaxID=267362 RepID=A0A559KJL7_9MOLU|nr:cyclic-di-AMP receptor [Candidatus Phytoplasma pini]TVY12309.1 hypothetical protein MDPP_00189 [Candidatus Phytoplasma pini]